MRRGWGRRRRRGRVGRLPKTVNVEKGPLVERFIPVPQITSDPVYLDLAELEVLRLVDLEDLSQIEAGERMGISRGTIWRLLHNARKKIAQAITEARPLHVSSTGEKIPEMEALNFRSNNGYRESIKTTKKDNTNKDLKINDKTIVEY